MSFPTSAKTDLLEAWDLQILFRFFEPLPMKVSTEVVLSILRMGTKYQATMAVLIMHEVWAVAPHGSYIRGGSCPEPWAGSPWKCFRAIAHRSASMHDRATCQWFPNVEAIILHKMV